MLCVALTGITELQQRYTMDTTIRLPRMHETAMAGYVALAMYNTYYGLGRKPAILTSGNLRRKV